MRALIQRVARAAVRVGEETVGQIGRGLLILVGVGRDDTSEDVDWLAQKVVGLRIFEDANGKFEQSLQDIGGEALVVSQFTLYGDAGKGRRPSLLRRLVRTLLRRSMRDWLIGLPTSACP
jgi:D-aminoacyl-tRNA deacylase